MHLSYFLRRQSFQPPALPWVLPYFGPKAARCPLSRPYRPVPAGSEAPVTASSLPVSAASPSPPPPPCQPPRRCRRGRAAAGPGHGRRTPRGHSPARGCQTLPWKTRSTAQPYSITSSPDTLRKNVVHSAYLLRHVLFGAPVYVIRATYRYSECSRNAATSRLHASIHVARARGSYFATFFRRCKHSNGMPSLSNVCKRTRVRTITHRALRSAKIRGQ